MGPKQTAKSRGKRTHSLGGCATCRRRHVKCDQVQPLCLTCKAVGVVCEGYASNVQWVAASTSTEKSKVKKPEANTTRRHLYSEKSRASMSNELTANLSSNSVDASLTEIDSWTKNNQSTDQDNLAVGPFGVLSFNTTTQKSTSHTVQPVEDELEVTEEPFPTPSTLDPLMSLDDSLQWADLFALDFGNEFLMQQDPFAPIVQDLGTHADNSGLPMGGQVQQSDQNGPGVRDSLENMAGRMSTITIMPVSPLVDMITPSSELLGETHTLLRHFQDKVIDAMAGVPWTFKSPWKSLNLANAVQTLADMTFLGEKAVKHANAANLYSLMSSAAHHMVATSINNPKITPDRLNQIAGWTLEKAKFHLEQSMRNEFQGPTKAKYKDQLMATMSIVCACQASGSQNDVRRYMLECERILRLRGLAKREISRKARTLHHVYTWTRIVSESTYVIHDYASYAPVIQSLNLQHQKRVVRQEEAERLAGLVTPNTSHNARLDDFLRVETQHDSDLEIDEQKEATIGLHDIHLEDSRVDPASLYLQIYGIPETWLSLVSQTTRLANVMDTLKVSNKETNVAFQNALQKRAGRLENMICSFAFKSASGPSTTTIGTHEDTDLIPPLPNYHMIQALNSALVIFFYRRIRDVNPWILQSHVDDVIKSIQDFHETLLEQNRTGPGTSWPAFIAGCEALAPHRREVLLNIIQTGGASTGMRSYRNAEEIMREVWKKRDESNNGPSPRSIKHVGSVPSSSRTTQPQWTWVEVLREKNMWLILS